MTCRACTRPTFQRPGARGLCIGHAFLFLLGPCATVADFILRSHATRTGVECAREEA